MPKSKHRKVKRRALKPSLAREPALTTAHPSSHVADGRDELQLLRQAESRFHERRGDKFAKVERFDTFAVLRNKLRVLAESRGEWAGYPLPLEGERLIVEPTYPLAKGLMSMYAPPEEDVPATVKHRNRFWSTRWRCDVDVFEMDGKIVHCRTSGRNSVGQQLKTLGCSEAWGVEQESAALQTLAGLVRHHSFKHYLMTGSFLERSRRSGLMYMFRKLRPTVVLDMKRDFTRILCALCMHPIAYYEGSWAGAMCPTDDVIAHLMLMRADEPMLWRRSNQHPAHRPEAGL